MTESQVEQFIKCLHELRCSYTTNMTNYWEAPMRRLLAQVAMLPKEPPPVIESPDDSDSESCNDG